MVDFQPLELELSIPKNSKNREYQLKVGDIINVKFYYVPELNTQVEVRSDGNISLQLIDDIYVQGFTLSKLDDLLTEKYHSFLRHPEITVTLVTEAPRRVYVGGEVASPGVFTLFPEVTYTSLQLIVMAGGAKNTAELGNVIVLRNHGTPQPEYIVLNLQRQVEDNPAFQDVILHHQDIIIIPKSKIASLNQFVDQYIEKIIPFSRSLGIYYNLNPEVQVK